MGSSEAPALSSRNPWEAVSVIPGANCCAAAAKEVAFRHLVREAPRLPLSYCTMPYRCRCAYQTRPDRRSGEDRRLLLGGLEEDACYAAAEKRARPRGRRSSDYRLHP